MKKIFLITTLMAAIIMSGCKKDNNNDNNNDNNDNDPPVSTLADNTFVVDGITYTICPECYQSSYHNGKYAWEYKGMYDSKFVKINFPSDPPVTGNYQIEAKGETPDGDGTWGYIPTDGHVQIWFQLNMSMTGSITEGYESFDGSEGVVYTTVNSDGTIKIQFTDITVRDIKDPSNIVKASGNYICK